MLVEVLLLLRVLEDGGRGGNAHGEEGDDVLEADIYLNDRTIRDNDYVYLDVMSKKNSLLKIFAGGPGEALKLLEKIV